MRNRLDPAHVLLVGMLTAALALIAFAAMAAQNGTDRPPEIQAPQGHCTTTPVTAYPLAVLSGTGSGCYAPGTRVPLTTTPPPGDAFMQWSALPDDTTIEPMTSAKAMLTMPAQAVSVRAIFAPLPPKKN